GSGGMAVVYKAIDTVLNRLVTVKILQDQFSSNQQFVIRFRKEAQAVAALSSHPNIVNVYDVGCSDDGEHYLIMEYVEGKTLKDVIKKNGSLSVKESLDYTNQILAGLSHAHSYGVIHRDIKPQNIMITNGNQVKIMDFGLALNLSDSTMTYDSSVFGSVYYIAPEIAQKGTGDVRADIYSTGIVLYEMLTGELPFTGDSPITIALQHVEGDFDSVDDIDEDIPYEVARVVDKAMSVEPDERYDSAKGMMRAIKNAADENDIPLKAIPVIAGAVNRNVQPEDNTGRRRKQDYDEDNYDVDFEKEYRNSRHSKKDSSSKNGRNNSRKKKKSNGKKIAILVVIGVLVLSAGIFAAYQAFSDTGDEVEVPMVVGHPVDEAEEMLTELGLKYNIKYAESEDVPVDEVMEQSVEPGQKVKSGRTIELTVSSGIDSLEVPSVVGKSQKSATTMLESSGFEVAVEEDYSDDVDEGDVISQDPRAGDSAPKGSTVTIVVSQGPETKEVKVPDVTGLTLSDAKNQLVAKNLTVGKVSEEYSDSVKEGIVMYQSVKEGTSVDEGTAVNLTVSKGPEENNNEDPDDPNENSPQTTTYSHTVSSNYESAVPVKVVVQDSQGEKTVYSNNCEPGEKISTTITYYPPGIIYCYENGSLVDQESF
ncbi:MAG: Stk1 family PASTA domain-containing Ser/Thr kinase, partial [Bacillota bacterium]|nr:Stk1 family PASTA domain-containing Ser/Thr kinase [Bacillota bacterium]